MLKLKVNNQDIEIEEGLTVLQACEKAGILPEIRKREFYEKPTQEKKRKKAAAVKRERKRVTREHNRSRRLY